MKIKTILFLVFFQLLVSASYAQWDSVGANPREKSILFDDVDISTLYSYRGNLIVGGSFSTVGGHIPVPGIAQWNGTAWDTIASGVEYPAAFAVYNGNLVALGYYPPQYSYIGQWNGSVWDSVGYRLNGLGQWIHLWTLCEYNGNLYAFGTLDVFPGGFTYAVKLDSGIWQIPPFGKYLASFATTIYKNKLCLGGNFDINGIQNIAAWNDTVLAPLGAGIDSLGSINALVVWNGKLYAGGEFDSAGGQPARNIAVWDGNKWNTLGKGVNGSINALTVYNDTLVVGGQFDSAGGVRCNNIAEWDGANWSTLGSGVIYHIKGRPIEGASINALCVYNGALYVGG